MVLLNSLTFFFKYFLKERCAKKDSFWKCRIASTKQKKEYFDKSQLKHCYNTNEELNKTNEPMHSWNNDFLIAAIKSAPVWDIATTECLHIKQRTKVFLWCNQWNGMWVLT